MNDAVNHPAHYTTGKIEVISFIDDKKLNYCRGNAVMYIVRAGLKDPAKTVEDLEKAVWYLNHEIEKLKADTIKNCGKCCYSYDGLCVKDGVQCEAPVQGFCSDFEENRKVCE